MKIINVMIILFVSIIFNNEIAGQLTVIGGCTSVTMTSPPSTNYQPDLIDVVSFANKSAPCEKIVKTWSTPSMHMTPQYVLQRKTTTGFQPVVSNFNGTFNNITIHGTYRVLATLPSLFTNFGCSNGIKLFTYQGQSVGFEGEYSTVTEVSNEVVVGKTVASDISTSWIDPTGSAFSGFSYLEPVKLNVAGCKNYDRFWLAVLSNPAGSFWASNGWTDVSPSSLPQEFDLSEFSTFGAPGPPAEEYMVQFAIENSQCVNSSWMVTTPLFYICNESVCRGVKETDFTISPNPASGRIMLNGNPVKNDGESTISITDLTGKPVYTSVLYSNEIDVSTLPEGLYLVALSNAGQKASVQKLVIKH